MAIDGVSQPTHWWTLWQALQGTHFSHLPTPSADLRGKLVVLTGGNNGIGREASLQFARYGASIVLGCRQPPPHETHPDSVIEECKASAQAEGHSNSTFEWWEIDMSDFESVEAFAKRWLSTSRPLDILCNNAGMGVPKGKKIVTKDGHEIVHQVNFLSHALLTLYLLPSLAKAVEPRIICTTSCMQFFGSFDLENPDSGNRPYPEAKIFLQTFLTGLQDTLLRHDKYRHITAQGVHPGYVITGIWNTTRPKSAEQVSSTRETEARRVGWLEWALNLLLHKVAINAQQGSLAITYAATQPECGPNPIVQGVGAKTGRGGGRYWNRTWEIEPMPQTKSAVCQEMLWKYLANVLSLDRRGLTEVLEP